MLAKRGSVMRFAMVFDFPGNFLVVQVGRGRSNDKDGRYGLSLSRRRNHCLRMGDVLAQRSCSRSQNVEVNFFWCQDFAHAPRPRPQSRAATPQSSCMTMSARVSRLFGRSSCDHPPQSLPSSSDSHQPPFLKPSNLEDSSGPQQAYQIEASMAGTALFSYVPSSLLKYCLDRLSLPSLRQDFC
jgi:hypothetical protein